MRLQRKIYYTSGEKGRDFLIGLGICFAANALLACVFFQGTARLGYADYDAFTTAVGVLALLLNVGGLIYFGFTRKWIALGALVPLSILLMLGLCLAALLRSLC